MFYFATRTSSTMWAEQFSFFLALLQRTYLRASVYRIQAMLLCDSTRTGFTELAWKRHHVKSFHKGGSSSSMCSHIVVEFEDPTDWLPNCRCLTAGCFPEHTYLSSVTPPKFLQHVTLWISLLLVTIICPSIPSTVNDVIVPCRWSNSRLMVTGQTVGHPPFMVHP